MNYIKYKNFYKEAVETTGKNYQIGIAIEEFAELIKELNKKHFRNKENIEEIIEEVADAKVVLNQLKYIYNIPKTDKSKEGMLNYHTIPDIIYNISKLNLHLAKIISHRHINEDTIKSLIKEVDQDLLTVMDIFKISPNMIDKVMKLKLNYAKKMIKTKKSKGENIPTSSKKHVNIHEFIKDHFNSKKI